MGKLLFSLGLIICGLILGYIWQLWLKQKSKDPDQIIPSIRKTLQKIGLLFFMPISFVAAIWVVSFENVRLVLLPFIGGTALLVGGLLGLGVAVLLKRDGRQKGALYCCGSFTNIGSIGALVAFVFLGEIGFALVALYKMFEETIYYTIGFPVARYLSTGETYDSIAKRAIEISKDPFVRAALGAFICGLALNLSPIERPGFFETMNSFFVPAGTFVLLVSIGLGMQFASVKHYLAEGFFVSIIKFIIIPILSVTIALLFGFAQIQDGLPLKVVLIASSMPVAFTALVAASIYDLDLNMANACWLITTASLVIVLPILYLILPLMG